MTKEITPRIRIDVRDGGGTYHEYFDRTNGWQNRIRSWIKHINVGAGKEAIMHYASDGISFNYVKTMITT